MQAARIGLAPGELASLTQKLEAFAATLPPNERAFLEQLIADAADSANEDPSGYANVGTALRLQEDDVIGHSADGSASGPIAGAVVAYADGLAAGAVA